MNRWLYAVSALPLLMSAGVLAQGCGDDGNQDDCSARATCTPTGSGGSDGGGGSGEGGMGQGGMGQGGMGQGGMGQGGMGQGGMGQGGMGGMGQGGQGGVMMGSCVPWENGPGSGIPASCGTFVASSGGATGDGSIATPYGTVSEAMAAAQSGDAIYLCNETFAESITVPSGVTVYGGLACTNGWGLTDGNQTVIDGVADQPAARFSDGTLSTLVYDMQITSPNAIADSGSSVAALIEGGTVSFERVDVTAGNGANGVSGTTPTTNIGPTDPNDASIKGNGPVENSIFCLGTFIDGATAKTNPMCTTSVGGASGDGAIEVPSGRAATVGNNGQVSGGSGGSPGGACLGGFVPCCGIGGSGTAASNGMVGAPAGGGTGTGAIGAAGWAGAPGAAGVRGAHGPGGGGGAGSYGVTCSPGGNGGGAGGCGGFGGSGGTAAGGSFAVIVLDGLFSTTLGSFASGTGGAGGFGQVGAVGGNPGTGGRCSGGIGGDGGTGGQGGGGMGGHSINVAQTSAATLNLDGGTTFSVGSAGPGGAGGDAPGNGATGLDGANLTARVAMIGLARATRAAAPGGRSNSNTRYQNHDDFKKSELAITILRNFWRAGADRASSGAKRNLRPFGHQLSHLSFLVRKRIS